MKKVVAVAMLDIKRMWVGLAILGVMTGILPSLATLVGRIPQRAPALGFVFLAGGMAAAMAMSGVIFGGDFAEGKPSFFFARPLSTVTQISGHIIAAIGACLITALGFTLAFWFTGRVHLIDVMREVTPLRLAVLPGIWALLAYGTVARVTNTRQNTKRTVRSTLLGLVRGLGSVALAAVMMSLFADVFMRALSGSPRPVQVLLASFATAMFVIVCVAIDRGRTNRLAIARLLVKGMYVYAALLSLAITLMWIYILHPSPSAIREVKNAVSSPDGRVAHVSATVDRGDRGFQPFFAVNLDSGDVSRMTEEYDYQPFVWYSRDGATKVWAEQKPLLFGLAERQLLGYSTFKFQAAFGAPQSMRLPDDGEFDPSLPLTDRPTVVLAGGDLVGVLTGFRGKGQRLSFVSPSRGLVSQIDTTALHRNVTAMVVRPSGKVRMATTLRPGASFEVRQQVVDVDPATGALTVIADSIAGISPRVHFDANADRALVLSGAADKRSLSLLTLNDTSDSATKTLVDGTANNIEEGFLADSRVAVIVRHPPESDLHIFSPDGNERFVIHLGVGYSSLGNEPFPNTLTVTTSRAGQRLLSFFDTTTGAMVHQMEGVYPPQSIARWYGLEYSPPPGTPGARMLISGTRLMLLPSLKEQPRQLLPRP